MDHLNIHSPDRLARKDAYQVLVVDEFQRAGLGLKLTAGNVDNRAPVPELTRGFFGKLFGDKGYPSQSLFEQLYERGVQLSTRLRKTRTLITYTEVRLLLPPRPRPWHR